LGQEVIREIKRRSSSKWDKKELEEFLANLDSIDLKLGIHDQSLRKAVMQLEDLAHDGQVEWATAMDLLSEDDQIDPLITDEGGAAFLAWTQAIGIAGPIDKNGQLHLAKRLELH
jgi:hypothetical protein